MKSKSIKILERLAWEEKKKNNPNMPDHCLAVPKFSDNTANALTKAIIKFITLSGYQAERISVTGRRIDKRKIYVDGIGRTKQIGNVEWIPSSMKKGSADISSIINGITWKIEVKIGKDRQKDAQKEYEKDVKQAGGHYSIVRSFDDFYKQYCEIVNKPKI